MSTSKTPLGTLVAEKLKEFRQKVAAAESSDDVAGFITDYKIFFSGAAAAATALSADTTPLTRAVALIDAEEALNDVA